jgi:alcohol dehydrogenase (cytochrome c)
VCEIRLNEPGWFSSDLLMVGRTVYVNTRRITYAFDGATCALQWRHVITEGPVTGTANNRGLGYLNGTLFRGTATGHMLALDAATGNVVWDVQNATPTPDDLGESFVSAPIAWNGEVFSGTATSDFGIRGRMMAFDAKTGVELWRRYTVPDNMLGGGFWTSYSLDPKTGELFIPVANPFPDWTGSVRPGPNLLTNAIVSLNPASGGINWYYQAVPHDVHDWDLGTSPTLYRTRQGVDMMALAGKDGLVRGIDRKSMTVVFTTSATTRANFGQNFPAPPTQVCPGGIGGAQFNGTAYNPDLSALYVGMVDWCWFFFFEPNPSDPDHPIGDDAPEYNVPPQGWITALDSETGTVLWQYHAQAQVQAGLVPTKSGLLFAGDTLGNLLALDAKSGAVLNQINTGGALNNGLISYAIGGNQYVAAAVGGISLNSPGITRPLRGGSSLKVSIYGLNGNDTPKIVSLNRVPIEGDTDVAQGAKLYISTCRGCHGFPDTGGFNYPLLARQEYILTHVDALKTFLKTVPPPMPLLHPGLLNDDDIEKLVAYIRTFNLPPQPAYTQPTSGGTAEWPAIYSVLTHPRCLNCHTVTDYPRQADDRHPHYYAVVRGANDMGAPIALCTSCHGTTNNSFTGVPGATGWHIAPLSMAWETSPNVAMTGNELCTVLKDRTLNGNRDLDALLDHVTTEPLVLWAFAPGTRLNGEPRDPPPLTHDEFVAKFQVWVNAGGPCPAPSPASQVVSNERSQGSNAKVASGKRVSFAH